MKRSPAQRRLCAAFALTLLAAVAHPPAARAQSPVVKTTAAALFQEAKALMERGDFAAACPKLEESHRLDPGGGTLLNLALCRKREGRTATAWVHFREAAAVAVREGNAEREAAARAEIAELEPTLSRVVVTVPEPVRVAGLAVAVDGVPLDPVAWGVPTPVDPKVVLVEVTAPGHVPWQAKLDASAPASRSEVTVPALERSAATAAPAPGPSTTVTPATPSDAGSGDGQRVAGLVIGGVGVAGLAVGAVTGALALGAQSSADEACPTETCADAGAVDDNERARSFATVSNIGFIAGGALLAAGATIFLLAPSGGGTAGASVRGHAVVSARGPSIGLSASF